MGVDDAAVRDTEVVEVLPPSVEGRPVRARERDVVEAHAALVEGGTGGRRERVQTDQLTTTDREHDVVERAGVLVQDGVDAEQAPVPGDAGGQVGHGQRDVGEGRELRMTPTVDAAVAVPLQSRAGGTRVRR
ncbi:hypothetical protein GCM10009557_72130 [Virgisporangium ochraceum]|uniref:Uncharacterized protein n=1 Tax=Virgisporangium ochraceum TaxID=65505 RepID=A0A8J4EE76_9ACTN|nr:hypothetical protein Voc01_072270 [Virgisporangium ochraceum]